MRRLFAVLAICGCADEPSTGGETEAGTSIGETSSEGTTGAQETESDESSGGEPEVWPPECAYPNTGEPTCIAVEVGTPNSEAFCDPPSVREFVDVEVFLALGQEEGDPVPYTEPAPLTCRPYPDGWDVFGEEWFGATLTLDGDGVEPDIARYLQPIYTYRVVWSGSTTLFCTYDRTVDPAYQWDVDKEIWRIGTELPESPAYAELGLDCCFEVGGPLDPPDWPPCD